MQKINKKRMRLTRGRWTGTEINVSSCEQQICLHCLPERNGFIVTASLFDKFCFGLLTIHAESSYFLLLLCWFFLLVFHLLPFYFLPPVVSPPSWPWLDSGEIEADVPGAHNCPQPYPQHLPFVLDQQLTPRKNWPYRHAHTYKEHRCTNLYWLNSCPLLNEQYTHTHMHTHAHTPSAVQISSVFLIVATVGSGLVSASRAEGLPGQLAWLILMLEATGSQTKGQKTPGGQQARDLMEQGVCDLSKV